MAREDREQPQPARVARRRYRGDWVPARCAPPSSLRICRTARDCRRRVPQFLLAYPIGYVVLVLIVVGAATVAGKRSRAPWEALTAAFALLALGSALGSTAVGHSEAVQILTEIQWPAATLLIAASMWADPGVPDPLAVRKGTAVWIPALACAATIVVLFAATLTHVDHAATALATAALVLVMLRAYSELRQEIAARERTEKDLRVSEAEYRRVADRAVRAPSHRHPRRPVAPPPTSCSRRWPRRSAAPSRTRTSPWSAGTTPDATIEYVGAWEKGDDHPNFIGDRVPLGGRERGHPGVRRP